MRQRLIRAPFPWFGGKSRVAHLVWERFGQVRNYVEPFAGSLAVLLGRPDTGGPHAYMRALSDRLRSVRVCCGDFERILGPAVTTCIGTTGVFLDPPYPSEDRAVCYSHDSAEVWWRAYRWAVEHGADVQLRLALCGYEHPGAIFPAGWTEIPWKASGGYGSRTERGRANARRERIWFSPACLQVGQGKLF